MGLAHSGHIQSRLDGHIQLRIAEVVRNWGPGTQEGLPGQSVQQGLLLYAQATLLQLMIEIDQLQFNEIQHLAPMPPACKHMCGRRPATSLQAVGS